jgi:hypothetical protein
LLMPGVSFQSRAEVVGHPVQPLSPVGRADARSAQIGSPAGISQVFHVKTNSGEPFAAIFARNLFAKDRCRPALGDEAVKSGPQVPLVGVPLSLASARKRLTGTGSGPDSGHALKVGPSQSERPSADAGEKMTLCESLKLMGLYLGYAALIDHAVGQFTGGDQFAQPCASQRVVVVVVNHGFGRCSPQVER